MAQYILVASGVTNIQFEKAIEIKISSGGKVAFVPQTSTQHGVQTHGMSSIKPNPQAKDDFLNIVRFEWNDAGAEFGAEIVKVLARHHHELNAEHAPAA